MPPLNILVFGAGAIGTYIGGSLALNGERVVFIERPEVAEGLSHTGLRLNLAEQEKVVQTTRVCGSLAEAMDQGPFDVAVFALKSFDTQAALEGMRPFASRMPAILCLQNGVENETAIAAVLGADKVISGTVTSAIGRRAAGDIVLERLRGMGVAASSGAASSGAASSGAATSGAATNSASTNSDATNYAETNSASIPGAATSSAGKGNELAVRVQQALDRAGLNCKLFPKAEDMKWSKMLTNLVGNATSAILDMTPGEIFGHPGLYRLEIAQLRETLAVMRAQEIEVVDLPATPVRMLALGARLPQALSRPLMARAIGGGRGAKMPSFHIDLHSGRAQSEVDWLNGAVVRAGQRLGIPTPANRLLNETLLALTHGEIPLDTFARQPKKLLDKFITF
jgi:2-dehydropantoate 2-reductase